MEDVEALELLDLLYRLSRSVIGDAKRSTAGTAELDMPEFVLLRAVVAGATSPGDLARELDVHPAAVSRTVTRLVRAGLLERRPAADDSRRFTLTLTSHGRDTTDAVAARVRPATQERLSALGPKEQARLFAALRVLVSR